MNSHCVPKMALSLNMFTQNWQVKSAHRSILMLLFSFCTLTWATVMLQRYRDTLRHIMRWLSTHQLFTVDENLAVSSHNDVGKD